MAGTDLAEEDLLGELILDLALDGATQRTCTENRIESSLGQQRLRLLGELDPHVLVLELGLDATDHQVDHLDDLVLSELVEHDDVVDTVEELRSEVLLELVVDLVLHPLVVGLGAGALVKPRPTAFEMSDVPRFDVKISTVFLKSTVRP